MLTSHSAETKTLLSNTLEIQLGMRRFAALLNYFNYQFNYFRNLTQKCKNLPLVQLTCSHFTVCSYTHIYWQLVTTKSQITVYGLTEQARHLAPSASGLAHTTANCDGRNEITSCTWSISADVATKSSTCASRQFTTLLRLATNLKNLEYSGISLNMENSGNSQVILCNLREKL